MQFSRLAPFLLFLLSTEFALAKPYFETPFISAKALNGGLIEGSKEQKKEVERVLKIQQKIDFDEVDEAFEERNLKAEMVAQFVDASLTRKQNPKIYHLLERASDTVWAANTSIKKYWLERRPYQVDSRIWLLIPGSKSSSYPSSHTSKAYIWALVLGEIFPQKKEQFLQRAGEIAQHRVLVGLHFQRDIEGGKQLANLVFEALKRDENFVEDFKKAKVEVENL
jgi:acid phosphatase (class A)